MKLVVYSDNLSIYEKLDSLFSVLNVDDDIGSWARSLCENGNHFLLVDSQVDGGIVNLSSVSGVRRETNYDKDSPMKYRYRWNDQTFENWQVVHFRLLGDDTLLPYGTPSPGEPIDGKRVRRVLISELNKVAIMHLHSLGHEGKELIDFELALV